jgi:HEAT repeat protein
MLRMAVMAVTLQQVKAHLDQEEPDYESAASLGPEALPHLLQLVKDGEPGSASKATYLAAAIGGDRSLPVIEEAVASPNLVIRAAAAGALRRLQDIPVAAANALLDDKDPGIRHLTLQALEIHLPQNFKAKVQNISQNDPEAAVRSIAGGLTNRLP